ncbi:MAG: NAD-dependent epimerase/dehydratase family protein [Bacteroidota bacterium]
MKVLLTGYSGLLGRHIARALKQDGHHVRVVLHKRTVTRQLFKEEADELLWGSLEDPKTLHEAVKGVDIVVHSAWKFSTQTASRPTMNEVVTENLLKASIAAGVKKFAFVSSVAVYGMAATNGTTVTEQQPLDNAGHFIYPLEKVNMESLLSDTNTQSMSIGIFRPGPIFDDHKSPIKKIIAGRAIGFGTGRNTMPYIHASDVADGIARWIRLGKSGGVYNLTPNKELQHREWYVAWARQKGFRVTPFFIRATVLRWAAAGATLLKRMLGKPGRVDVDYAIAAATRSMKYSNGHAVTELQWKPTKTDRYHG